MTTAKAAYTEKKIREGYSTQDVQLWHGLLRDAETEIGSAQAYLFAVMELALHNDVQPLDMIKTGRLLSGQKKVNDKFMCALHDMVDEDNNWIGEPIQAPGGNGDSGTVNKDIKPKATKVKGLSTGVLDLTADDNDESSSGSYEETDGYYEYDADPNSAEAYEIDGFVVPDHHSQSEPYDDVPAPKSATSIKVNGLAHSNALAGKRKLETIIEAN